LCEGLADREELNGKSSSGMGIRSGWKAGNLNVACGLESRSDVGAMATALEVFVGRDRGTLGYAMGPGRVQM
tara:strand:- start:21743 stop:21958 length:216 start_codon:yes stop_codon:yes gene_type:complete